MSPFEKEGFHVQNHESKEIGTFIVAVLEATMINGGMLQTVNLLNRVILLEKWAVAISPFVLEKISPEDDDFFLIKPKHSAFYETALNTLLYQLVAKHVILTGIAGNICVLFSANEAYIREYNIYVPADCIASNTKEENDFALRMMKEVLGADIKASNYISFVDEFWFMAEGITG
ncbi:isochorismatase family cysteine hydrolase [Bacillus sp. 1P06AnD]|uniref:isochorismatase family cysteine hydrolase n=1 Tax=Bacillus sp. 1P06AnD TaxID=3132208 RepID=UPI0039A3E676